MRSCRFACVFLCGCGRLLDESDAGDAANDAHTDAPADATNDGGFFSCGEGSIFVYCDPASEYCLLQKSSSQHQYSCVADPPNCADASVASAPFECGCFTAPSGDMYVTVCK